MRKLLLSLAAITAITIPFISPSFAEARGHGGGHHGHVAHRGHAHVRAGYRHGRYHGHYLRRGYRGWSRWYWNTGYGCYYYLCPTNNTWYYYYAPSRCYLPTSQIATYPPVAVNITNVTPTSGALPQTPPSPF